MIYDRLYNGEKNWILAEERYKENPDVRKCESIMCQGNGYMCVRAATEEVWGVPFVFVAGTFNKLPEDWCTELPNSPDFTAVRMFIDGEQVTPDGMVPKTYDRYLNLKTGLLERKYTWKNSAGEKFELRFLRVVSLSDKHLCAMRVEVTSKAKKNVTLMLETGVDGDRIEKSAHMLPVDTYVEDGATTVVTKTSESGILFCTAAAATLDVPYEADYMCEGKTALTCITCKLPKGKTVALDKRCVVYTNRDRERDGCSEFCLRDTAAKAVKEASLYTFDEICRDSADTWEAKIWSCRDVKIDGCDIDQLALHFALYHLTCMSPVHDDRMNIGAKGMSGIGYCGHAFWDTEIYMLPYFIFSAPEEAKSLVMYRVNSLDAARTYAKKDGNKGARFPWEAAWITDGEATPTWCDTGDLELHITGDVAFGAYYYYMVTGDEEFMRKHGYELIFECASFWMSRVVWDRKKKAYGIVDVTGPNEFLTHVNNNAYTNYMAACTVELAIESAEKLEKQDPELYEKLNKKIKLRSAYKEWKEKVVKLYLPLPNEDGIIPENDEFLSLPSVCAPGKTLLETEGAWAKVQSLGGKAQVSKQADIVALLYMMEDKFTPECKVKNFNYYDGCCTHSSSLSLAIFSALAADLGLRDMAYARFSGAKMIDLNGQSDSNTGIHAASLGGIWQCCVLGFGGVRRYGERLRIEPNLPDAWNSLSFRITWHGQTLEVTEDKETLSVVNLTGTEDVQFLHRGKTVSVGDGVTLEI